MTDEVKQEASKALPKKKAAVKKSEITDRSATIKIIVDSKDGEESANIFIANAGGNLSPANSTSKQLMQQMLGPILKRFNGRIR